MVIKTNTMEVFEYEEQATQVQEEEHDYLEIIDRHRGEISPISPRLYYHLDTISNKIPFYCLLLFTTSDYIFKIFNIFILVQMCISHTNGGTNEWIEKERKHM
jgi:hypothetical protein